MSKYEPKIHLIGPITGGGFFRTVCEYSIEGQEVTRHAEKVTCAKCTRRMPKAPERATGGVS